MKTLCIDVRMLNSSGIGTYLRNLIPYIEEHYELILLGNIEELSSLKLKNSKYISFAPPIYSIREIFQLSLVIPPCDLFWSPHYNVPILPIRARKRVVTIHDVFHLKYYSTLSFSKKVYAKTFLNAATKLSDRVITVSHFSKQEIIKYLHTDDEKIHVIYNGIDKIFRETGDSKNRNTNQLKDFLPDNFILFVGNIKPHKNIINLIKAFSDIKKSEPYKNLKLVIVGKRTGFITGTKNLEELISSLNLSSEILFLENIKTEELPFIYNCAALLVFPSFYEGFGLPPLEAMACGCPVVASGIDCLKEIYQDSCLYITPSEPDSIQNGILSVLNNEKLRETMIHKGKEYAQKFSWENSANYHLNIFENILE